MFRRTHRPDRRAGVRFCDSCAAVTTADERARTRIERTRTHLTAVIGPR